MTAQASFRQKDVERACKGVAGAGLAVARVRVAPDGSIDIIIADNDSELPEFDNPLDNHVHGKKTKA